MDPIKVFVKQDNTTVIKCPECKAARNVPVSQFKDKKKILKIRCGCGANFSVSLEFRQTYRRETKDLRGTFVNLTRNKFRDSIKVKDVSMGGMGFTTPSAAKISPGDELEVSFTLDDKHRSRIEKTVVVRIVRGDFVGCEFLDTQTYDKALGFYLMP